MGKLVDSVRRDVGMELNKMVVCEVCELEESTGLMILKQRNVIVFAHICKGCKGVAIEGDYEIEYVSKRAEGG